TGRPECLDAPGGPAPTPSPPIAPTSGARLRLPVPPRLPGASFAPRGRGHDPPPLAPHPAPEPRRRHRRRDVPAVQRGLAPAPRHVVRGGRPEHAAAGPAL